MPIVADMSGGQLSGAQTNLPVGDRFARYVTSRQGFCPTARVPR